MWKQKKQQSKQNDNIEFNTFTNYANATLYHTYLLLYCKGNIQVTNIYSKVNVETEK